MSGGGGGPAWWAVAACAALLLAVAPAAQPGPAGASSTSDGPAPDEAGGVACPEATRPPAPFDDVAAAHLSGAGCASLLGLAAGVGGAELGAARPLTRGQAATLLWRAVALLDDAGEELTGGEPVELVDLDGGTHDEALERLAGLDPPVVRGDADGMARPRDMVTRAQLASLLVRFHKVVTASVATLPALPDADDGPGFADLDGHEVHAEAIERAAAAALLAGTAPSRFDPGEPLTRQQAATVLARLADRLVHHDVLAPALPAERPAVDLLGCVPIFEWGEEVGSDTGELYGPSRINAQSANGGLAAGVAADGTLTVLKWPSPSFYDQVKHRTFDHDEPWMGALANEGAFLGLLVEVDGEAEMRWLRDAETSQAYRSGRDDTVVTTHRLDDAGLTVEVRDTVAADRDVLVRHVEVERDEGSPVGSAELVSFANLDLVVTKDPYVPIQDWCAPAQHDHRLWYDADADALVAHADGVDASTGEPSRAAVAHGLDAPTSAVRVGGDALADWAAPAGRLAGPAEDAFAAAERGELAGGQTYAGQPTGLVAAPVDLSQGTASRTVHLAFAERPDEAAALLDEARALGAEAVEEAKRAWIEQELLADAPMPATDDEAITSVAERALVSLVTSVDRDSGAVVASIATQSPYGLDWQRDGAYFSHVLGLLGHHDVAAQRARWYADLQAAGQGEGEDNPFADIVEFAHGPEIAQVPAGAWKMNYYADGVPGGPIPWEIDEVGYGIWAMLDPWAATGDDELLADVYPAVRRSADLLVDWVDPDTGLHRPSIEDDNPFELQQTPHGAGPSHLGLDLAVAAAEALGHHDDAARWADRRDEIADALDAHLHDGTHYLEWGEPELVWPVCLREPGDPRVDPGHYERVWQLAAPTFAEPAAGERFNARYETKNLTALAKATRGDPVWAERVDEGLEWVATHHARQGTRVMGEDWVRWGDEEVRTTVSPPHLWSQTLFYLAALERHPPDGVDPGALDPCGGVVAALRDDVVDWR